MLVTLSGITRLLKEEHFLNALSPMLVTLSGITRLLKEEQPSKALFPMLVTLSGITYDIFFVSLNESIKGDKTKCVN